MDREEPFTPAYQGKWTAPADARRIREFPGVPKQAQQHRVVASIECIEDIHCDLCEKACPEDAIKIARQKGQFLIETDCTACGICLNACPSSVPVLLQERDSQSTSPLTLAWRGDRAWQAGEFATLVNRKGDSLASARVTGILSEFPAGERGARTQLVQLDVPTHLVWEARGLRRAKTTGAEDAAFLETYAREELSEKVEITVNGEKRLVRDGIPLTVALFEFGQSRPEDMLYCPDGSCGLCMLTVDSVRKSACQVRVRRGMSVRLAPPSTSGGVEETALCPCMGVTREQVIERARQGRLRSPEAVQSVTHVGEGRCHGQLCGEPMRRLLLELGLDPAQWVDWRFPWVDWQLKGDAR